MRSVRLALPVLLLAVSATAQTPTTLALPAVAPLGPRTVIPAFVACADQPTSVFPASTLRVVAPQAADRHEASTRNQLVVLNAGTLDGLMAGQQYFTRRLRPPAHGEPMTESTPGSIRTTGWLTVVAADQNRALARIDYACTAITSGDYLERYVEPVLPVSLGAMGLTNFAELSRVLFGIDGRESFGAGDLLSIDRGAGQGMVTGTRVAFYRDRANGTPLVELGTGIVIEVAATSSKVILERSTEDVRRGDYVGIRGKP